MTVINPVAPKPVTIMKKHMTEAQKVLLIAQQDAITKGKTKIKRSREHLLKKNKGDKARYIFTIYYILLSF